MVTYENGFHHLMRFLLIFHETFHHSFFLNMLRYIVRDAYQQLISFRSFYIRFSRLQYNLLLSLKMHHSRNVKSPLMLTVASSSLRYFSASSSENKS